MEIREIIKNTNFSAERALYGAYGMKLVGCSFSGEEDGESALKESENIILEDCRFELRYPLWHCSKADLKNCVMTGTCRAALWYSEDIGISGCTLGGIKALRECRRTTIADSTVLSPEFGWKSSGVVIDSSSVEGEYPFFMAGGIEFSSSKLKGKYSFQYVEDLEVRSSFLDTKDAFWHAKNVVVRDSVINGEYLAWYSENVVFINCKIRGTQPFCYCKGLRLIGCELEDADLAFEYSEVEADIKGDIISVKNPRSGHITADGIGEIIIEETSVYPVECKISERRRG